MSNDPADHREQAQIPCSMLGLYQEATTRLLDRLAKQCPPAPLPPPAPEPRERYWPAQPGAGRLPGVSIGLRHPACIFAFLEIEPRKIGRSPRSHVRGRQKRLPSMKMQRQIRANSGIEFDHLRDCELEKSVIKFVEQPFRLNYLVLGRKTWHRPDALLLTPTGLECREVKEEAQASLPENEERWPAIGRALNSFGVSFRVVTERHFREPVRLRNVNAIWENRMFPIPDEPQRIAILEAIDTGAARTISQLCSLLSLEFAAVLALIRRGFLSVDLSVPIADEARVHRGAGLNWAAGTRVLRR